MRVSLLIAAGALTTGCFNNAPQQKYSHAQVDLKQEKVITINDQSMLDQQLVFGNLPY